MIITEQVTIFGQDYIHTCSDENRYIVRNGQNFDYALDYEAKEYTEGDCIPPEPDFDELFDKAEAYDILMGVSE